MFRRSAKAVVMLMVASVVFSSCVGSFALFNKLSAWNQQATNSKIVNEILYLVISPAYGVCLAADALVLNSIEFWTGDNPVASNIGKTQQVEGRDGLLYAVKTLRNGYEVTAPDGQKTVFKYDKRNDAWSMEQNGNVRELFRFNGDGTIQATINGHEMNLTIDEAGLFKARMAAGGASYFACY